MILTQQAKKDIIDHLINFLKDKEECNSIEVSESKDSQDRKWFSVVISTKEQKK